MQQQPALPHRNAAWRALPNATSMLTGENVINRTRVRSDYVNFLDRYVADGIARGEITREQIDRAVLAAFAQDNGCLFFVYCFTDGTERGYGASVPPDGWFWAS